MKTPRIFAALCIAAGLQPAQAALWSVGNEVARTGDKATLTVSFTGDQRAAGAQTDVIVPRGFAVQHAKSLNGAACAVLPPVAGGPATVRVVTFSTYGVLPALPVAQCEIVAAAVGGYSDWFRLAGDLCIDGAAQPYACALDPGYVTVLP